MFGNLPNLIKCCLHRTRFRETNSRLIASSCVAEPGHWAGIAAFIGPVLFADAQPLPPPTLPFRPPRFPSASALFPPRPAPLPSSPSKDSGNVWERASPLLENSHNYLVPTRPNLMFALFIPSDFLRNSNIEKSFACTLFVRPASRPLGLKMQLPRSASCRLSSPPAGSASQGTRKRFTQTCFFLEVPRARAPLITGLALAKEWKAIERSANVRKKQTTIGEPRNRGPRS